MVKQCKNWSVEEKRVTVLAVLDGHQSVAEVAHQRGVNENQVYRWKDQFLDGSRQGLNAIPFNRFVKKKNF